MKIEGRMDDACILVTDVVRQLGASIRATFASQGVTDLEPDGEEANDIALAMVHMQRAVTEMEAAQNPEPKEEGEGETKH